MLRKPSATLVAACCLFAGNAGASFTIDLVWADTGTPTLTIDSGDGDVPEAACVGARYSGSTQNRCLQVRLTAVEPFTGVVSTLGWDAQSSGVALDFLPSRAFGVFGTAPLGLFSVFPHAIHETLGFDPGDCPATCDTAYGSFGGVSASAQAAGTYIVGSLGLDLSGATIGTHAILHYLRPGVGGISDGQLEPAPVQVNGAVLNVIPEPATASLLGLGVLALCAIAGRRR